MLNTTHIGVWIHHEIGTVTVPTHQTTRHLGNFIISDGQNPMFVSVGSIKDLFVRLIFLQSNGVWKSLYIFILISRSLSLQLILFMSPYPCESFTYKNHGFYKYVCNITHGHSIIFEKQ